MCVHEVFPDHCSRSELRIDKVEKETHTKIIPMRDLALCLLGL